MVGLWEIEEKKKGQKDNYEMRSEELGVIRMIMQKEWKLKMMKILRQEFEELKEGKMKRKMSEFEEKIEEEN